MVLKCRVVCCSLRRAVVDWVRRAMLDILGLKFSGSQAKIRGSLESYRENGIQCCSTERITCRRAFLGGGGMTARRAASRGESCRPGTEVARAEPRHGCPRLFLSLFLSLSRLPPTIRAGKVVSTLLHHHRRPHRSAIPYLAKHVSATTLLSGHEPWPLICETLFVRLFELFLPSVICATSQC